MKKEDIYRELLKLEEQINKFKEIKGKIKSGKFEECLVSIKLKEESKKSILDEDGSLNSYQRPYGMPPVFGAYTVWFDEDKKTDSTDYMKINPDYTYVFCDMIIDELNTVKKYYIENLKKLI